MNKYKIIQSNSYKCNLNKNVTLHEDILEILFRHKREIHNKLIDLKGSFLIDHISINIIDSNNRLVIFSITPSVEYNLIVQGLWMHDAAFSVQEDNSFYSWEKAYSPNCFDQLKYFKEKKHGFTYGFNIAKKMGLFHFIYSYATRSKNKDLREYFYSHSHELSALGDYGYKLIHDIYTHYCNSASELTSIIQKQKFYGKPALRLIHNNQYSG